MNTRRAGVIAVSLAVLALIAGCGREERDWRTAQAADTIEAYNQFLERHATSALATQARLRVLQLTEDGAWHQASTADTADAYRQFLTQYPHGKWAQEARIRIENFSLGQAQQPAQNAANPAPLAQTPAQAPAAAPVAQSTRAPAPAKAMRAVGTREFGIQVGAFASEETARREWRRMSARFGAPLKDLTPLTEMVSTPRGQLYRLRAAVSDEARAHAVCASLQARSQACFVVHLGKG